MPPPTPTKTINDMGNMNFYWGICGFTSSLYALHTHSRTSTFWEWLTETGPRAKLEAGGASPTKILAEIKTYLKILEGAGEQATLDSIEGFTQSFDGFGDWTIADYIQRVNAVVKNGANLSEPRFGIGMPPAAVVDYMKRVCGFSQARIIPVGNTLTLGSEKEVILGMGSDDITTTVAGAPEYNGLGHYLYVLNTTIYSWGSQFKDPRVAMNGVANLATEKWKIVCKIALA